MVQADYYYVVTEEVGGGELFERICDKETYTEHEARQLVKTLLQTLAFLHNKQVFIKSNEIPSDTFGLVWNFV
jgi:serine/threonine protein kinase